MPLSEHERRLLLTGTLDTSGVGGSPYEELPAVALAFDAETITLPSGREVDSAEVQTVTVTAPDGSQEQVLMVDATAEELAASVPAESASAQEKPAPAAKRAAAKKTQASKPATDK